MSSSKVGVWFVGAWGGVATTTAVGLAALRAGITEPVGLVTAQPMFEGIEFRPWDDFVIGGHEIRSTSYAQEARVLLEKSRVFTPELLNEIAPILAEYDVDIRPGTLVNVGDTIGELASQEAKKNRKETPFDAVERISADLNGFRDARGLDHVIVVNLASTEPPVDIDQLPQTWEELYPMLQANEVQVPASSLYAIAAMHSKCSYVNFTPSVGSDLPALDDLANIEKVLHCGRDGKTGETLLKSVLAPMFAARNLKVLSWVGHNIFGNMDGVVLNDPVNKATKVKSKDHLLGEILGYKPQSHVSIEYIESLADWKTAWDHIHFEGFLGTKMTMQFTWQGCDSLLAAPLVLDLIRLTDFEQTRGKHGQMPFLASFFKSPMGTDKSVFAEQFAELREWVAEAVRFRDN